MLRVRDAVSEPGSPKKPNEDGYGAAGAFAWIIDGATGLADSPLLDAASDAAWLTERISAAFHAGAERHADPAALLNAAAQTVTAEFAAEQLRPPAERYEIPTAAVLLAHFGDHVTICDVGDCGLYLTGDGTIARFGGSERGKALEQQNAANLMASGQGRTPEVMEFLRHVRNHANTPDGYAIFAPEPGWTDRVRVHQHPATAGLALFMTDGFEAAEEDYGLHDRAGLMAAAEAGLSRTVEAIRKLEASDLDCTRYPRFKPSDDATAMLIEYGA